MINTVIWLIHFLFRLFFITVLISVFISYFLDPYHPVRRFLDRIVNPFLKPIRKVVPLVGNIDFSPVILILLAQVAEYLLVWLVGLLR